MSELTVDELVYKVLQVPWPHTGEWMACKRPRFCPGCGSRQEAPK